MYWECGDCANEFKQNTKPSPCPACGGTKIYRVEPINVDVVVKKPVEELVRAARAFVVEPSQQDRRDRVIRALAAFSFVTTPDGAK